MLEDDVRIDNIAHYIQAGFLATIVLLRQIRDGQKHDPAKNEIEEAAIFLRAVSASLSQHGLF